MTRARLPAPTRWGQPSPFINHTGGPSLDELDMNRWYRDGLCRALPSEWWLSDQPDDTDLAVKICRMCPVRLLCLASALVHGDEYGVYGGTTPTERRHLTRRLRRDEPLGVVLADGIEAADTTRSTDTTHSADTAAAATERAA